MGATLEWDCINFTLTTPQGDLPLNQEDALGVGEGGLFLLSRDACQMGAPLRVTIDEIAAGDGSVPHEVFTSGYRVDLTVELWASRLAAAEGATLVAMNDLLMRHLNRCRRDGLGRLLWTPTGAAQRMVDDLWWVEDADAENGGGSDLLWAVKFGFASPFPYAMVAAETTTAITDGGTQTLDNTGTAPFYPVMKAYGPTSEFTISNAANGKQIHYDSAQPGAVAIPGSGSYLELDFFRQTAFLNGDVADRAAGVDPFLSEFFVLEIGENDISVDGADIDVLWQPAYA